MIVMMNAKIANIALHVNIVKNVRFAIIAKAAQTLTMLITVIIVTLLVSVKIVATASGALIA